MFNVSLTFSSPLIPIQFLFNLSMLDIKGVLLGGVKSPHRTPLLENIFQLGHKI